MTNFDELTRVYSDRHNNILEPLAKKLEDLVTDIVKGYPRIDRIQSRAKSIKSFLDKSQKQFNGIPKYNDPLEEIQDQIGVRIITFYLSDLQPICDLAEKYFSPIEKQKKEPDNENEFGYEGFHYIFFIPSELIDQNDRDNYPKFFELQIKTLYQHAWAQADHDLAYKGTEILSKDMKRNVAFTAAQSWGADRIFNELFALLHKADTTQPIEQTMK